MHDMQDGADGKGPDEVQDRVRRLIERAAASTPAMDFHREQFQQAGVRFKANIPSLHPVGLPKAFRAGMQPFGHWLNAPGFVGIEGMKAAMKKADPRDLWAMKPFSDVCEKRSLHPVGRLDTDVVPEQADGLRAEPFRRRTGRVGFETRFRDSLLAAPRQQQENRRQGRPEDPHGAAFLFRNSSRTAANTKTTGPQREKAAPGTRSCHSIMWRPAGTRMAEKAS